MCVVIFCYVRFAVLIFLFFAISAFSVEKVPYSGPNVPLPRQNVFTGTGMSVGLAAGVFAPTGECDCIGMWQAQGDFFYFPWGSGGLEARFFGGNLDERVMVRFQRYRVKAKFYLHGDKWALFGSPVLGLENTDISEFRNEVRGRGSDDDLEDELEDEKITEEEYECEKMLALDGFSVGFEAGGGMTLGKYFGLTGSALYEYSFSEVSLLTVSPGVAFDMRSVWGWAHDNLNSIWISVEVSAQRYFKRDLKGWFKTLVVGFQLGI